MTPDRAKRIEDVLRGRERVLLATKGVPPALMEWSPPTRNGIKVPKWRGCIST